MRWCREFRIAKIEANDLWPSDSAKRACARISRALLLRNRFKRWASGITDSRCTTGTTMHWRKSKSGIKQRLYYPLN